MSEIATLLTTTKRLLKHRGMTYRDLARELKLSEPTVKRMFAAQGLTLERLAQIASLLGYTLAELTQEAASHREQVRTLSPAQEQTLVADSRLLLVAVCVINHWTLADMLTVYRLSEAECLQALLQLDRMRLIELMPGNRIRLRIARDFDWLPAGPIRQFFRAQLQEDYLASEFADDDAALVFAHGMLSDTAHAQLQNEMRRLRKRLSELHEECLAMPLAQKRGASLLLSVRRGWEPRAFAALRRQAPTA